MKLSLHRRVGAIALTGALAISLAACGSDNPTGAADPTAGGDDTAGSELSGALDGAGASSQESAMEAWRAGFQSANQGVNINYDPVGSGGGRTQFLEGGVQFAGSDAALKDDELAQSEERCVGGQAIDLPLYISPIAVVYNLEGVDELNLSPSVMAGIFDRKITTWSAPEIAADNPGVSLPDLPITPVNRSDESGTTENFTEYLAATAGPAWPYEASGDWPVSGGQSAQGTSGVVQTIQGGNGTIGYADASKAGSLGTAKIKVGDQWVGYSPEAAAAVVDASPRVEGRYEHDIVVELDRTTTAAGAYPLVLISYSLACTSYEDEADAELVKAFLGYVASEEGQEAAATAAGSAPISDELRADVEAALESITAGA
ncbi:phosphate ABC transporter substrate-binding protein PstS [Cellulomonas fimi]|uniref:Phosphate-binding protein n=1 Tax=Cellulomonas fimi TaxID=1708 RepID=A0A7Y0LY52_CELFI|nr:phosphate ABC transporter substrate-binding protein PstS [Cellulomonas fimi]NMR20333.1 phosphate ABC transporter substrate-binding protein PstS [Cellulomonas fimi]